MFNLRRVLVFWAVILLTFTVVGQASAQSSLKITKTGVTHTASRGSNNRGVTLINRADCDADDVITFPVVLSGFSNYKLQAWVGTNCSDVMVRQNTTQRSCWLVADTVVTGTVNTINLGIHVSSMVSGYTTLFGSAGPTTDTGGTGGATSTAGAGGDAAAVAGSGGTSSTGTVGIGQLITPDPAYCTPPNPQNVQGSTGITLFIMLVDNSSGASVANDQWAGTFKLVGPPAPDQVSAGVGGNLLVVDFSYTTQPADTTGNGFYVYCDPAGGNAAAVDAGLIDADGGSPLVTSCGDAPSKVLFEGDPPPSSEFRCGTGQKTSRTANATGLVNGAPYNVAVAAFDTYDNIGPLSAPVCKIPQPVTGFYKAYRDAGGEGGGGFCSFSPKREPMPLVILFGVASCLVLRRRRVA